MGRAVGGLHIASDRRQVMNKGFPLIWSEFSFQSCYLSSCYDAYRFLMMSQVLGRFSDICWLEDVEDRTIYFLFLKLHWPMKCRIFSFAWWLLFLYWAIVLILMSFQVFNLLIYSTFSPLFLIILHHKCSNLFSHLNHSQNGRKAHIFPQQSLTNPGYQLSLWKTLFKRPFWITWARSIVNIKIRYEIRRVLSLEGFYEGKNEVVKVVLCVMDY